MHSTQSEIHNGRNTAPVLARYWQLVLASVLSYTWEIALYQYYSYWPSTGISALAKYRQSILAKVGTESNTGALQCLSQ